MVTPATEENQPITVQPTEESQPITAMSTAGYVKEGKYQKRHRATFGLLVCVALTSFLLVATGASVFGWFLITHREDELFQLTSPSSHSEEAQELDMYDYKSGGSISEPSYKHEDAETQEHSPITSKQTMTSTPKPQTTTTTEALPTTTPDAGVDISQIMDRLWQASRPGYLSPGDDFVLDIQGKTSPNSTVDQAPDRLFTRMLEDVRRYTPLHRKFIRLLNDYATFNVDMTRLLSDQVSFLDALCKTDTVSILERFLLANEFLEKSQNVCTFMENIWFTISQINGRAGLDQVYVNGEVGSVGRPDNWPNNWLQLYLEEKAESLDYQGFIAYNPNILLQARYSWTDIRWPMTTSTIFLGSSPDFEVAAYTVCLVVKPNERCSFMMNGEDFAIETRTSMTNSGVQITSANFVAV